MNRLSAPSLKSAWATAAACAVACSTVLLPAWAHPDTKESFMAVPTPGGEPAQGNARPGAVPPAPVQAKPPLQTPEQAPIKPPIRPAKPWLEKQLTDGYVSNVLMRVGQVAHAHATRLPGREPVEIWYVATRKPYTAGQVVYCVAPRVEVPGPTAWDEADFEVKLHRPGEAEISMRVSSSYPAGASRELQPASNQWCSAAQPVSQEPPRRWVLETAHGQAYVVFPFMRPAPQRPGGPPARN